jgi:AraC-like DNA-binding protein
MNTDAHLIQCSFFQPVLETLRQSGVNAEKLLLKSSLSRVDLGSGENYVPVNLLYALMLEIHKSQGIDDFYDCFAAEIDVQNLSDFGEITAFSPDLLSAARFAEKNITMLMTHGRMRLEIDGPICKVSQWYIDAPKPGRDFVDYVDLCYLLNAFRIAMGADWTPLEIHLQSQIAPDFDNLFPDGRNIRILLGQPVTAVVVPTAIMRTPMMGDGSLDSNHLATDSIPGTLSQVIERILASSKNAQVANMGLMADMLDISPRTLRRKLSELDTTFFEVVDSWRFKSSLELLEDEQAGVNEIAERLGYANTPNFERAFKRWTGTSPGNYRDLM